MKISRLTLWSIPALISSIVWGLLGVYLVIIKAIDFIRNVRTYPDLMDMVVLFFFGGVTFIISAIL